MSSFLSIINALMLVWSSHPDVKGKSGPIFGISGEAARSLSFLHVHHKVHDR